jgi:hypothetical protein
MKNPFKPDHSTDPRDNPVVPNEVERPLERAAVRSAERDNPLVPNSIERPVERAFADDRPEATDAPTGRGERASAAAAPDDSSHKNLFPDEELLGYRTQWEAIQTGFVDRPRAAVEEADALVAQVVTRVTEMFTRERSMLEEQWTEGDDVSTEDLRIMLTRYRSFFHRLLST